MCVTPHSPYGALNTETWSSRQGRSWWGHASLVAPTARSVKDRLSGAGGPRFESQAGRVAGKPTPSLWRDKQPAIKGHWPPEHHTGQFHPDQKDPS